MPKSIAAKAVVAFAVFATMVAMAASSALAAERSCDAELIVADTQRASVVLRFTATANHFRPNRARERARDRAIRCGQAVMASPDGVRSGSCIPGAGVDGVPTGFNLRANAHARFCLSGAPRTLFVRLRTYGGVRCGSNSGLAVSARTRDLGQISIGAC